MVDKEKLLEMADDIKSTIHEKQEQTVFDYKVYSICCQVQAMLKEQEAVEPVPLSNHRYACGNCGNSLWVSGQRFCASCGRKVKWNGSD